ncbi:MAG: hypothetical protein U9Q69_05445 [Nanoarchaeota archaeon]|nr:hypothetical protein [Nanoarchaeota archaeon]
MIPAKLMKELEKKGFELEFPRYGSNDEKIIAILKKNNERLYAAIPILLIEKFDYNKIKSKLSKNQITKFNHIILIAKKIFSKGGINKNLEKIINENKIKQNITKQEIDYYYSILKEAMKRRIDKEEENREKELNIRSMFNENQALTTIFSPGKIRIMNNIYNHKPLTNTELKYYYRSIRPYIQAILNENLRKYVRIIESSKKYREV